MNYKLKIYGTLITAIIEGALFSGANLGWSSLVYILKDLNFFNEQCQQTVNNGTHSTAVNQDICLIGDGCAEQDSHFSTIFTVSATATNFICLLFGFIMDRYGTWVTRFLACTMVTLGSGVMTFATPSSAFLVYIGMPLMASGGVGLLITNMQIGNLFPKSRGLVITFMNGLFGSSSGVYLVFKLIYQMGIDLNIIFMGYTILSILCFIRTILFMPKITFPFTIPDGYDYGYCEIIQNKSCQDENDDEMSKLKPKPADDDMCSDNTVDSSSDGSSSSSSNNDNSFRKCLTTSTFIINVVYFGILCLRLNFFMSSYFSWISDLVNRLIPNCVDSQKTISKYINVMGIIQLLEAVTYAPFVGLISDLSQKIFRIWNPELSEHSVALRSNSICLGLCAVFGFMSCVIPCIDNIPVQSLSVLSICIFRSFYVGTTAMFISYAFPVDHFGKLYGITRVAGGFCVLLSAPIFNTVVKNGNKFKSANFDFAVVTALCMAHPISVWLLSSKKQKEHEHQLEHEENIKIMEENKYPDKYNPPVSSTARLRGSSIKFGPGIDPVNSRHLNSSVVINSLQNIAA